MDIHFECTALSGHTLLIHFTEIRRPNGKIKIIPMDSIIVNFNLSMKYENPRHLPRDETILDILPTNDKIEVNSFVIPKDKTSGDTVALVPILYENDRIVISYNIAVIAAVICGMVITFSYSSNRFKNTFGHLRLWDIIRLLLDQSIDIKTKKST